jgi:hypothetical protein
MLLDAAIPSRDETVRKLADAVRSRIGEDADVRVVGDSVVISGQFENEYGGKPFVMDSAIEAARGNGT